MAAKNIGSFCTNYSKYFCPNFDILGKFGGHNHGQVATICRKRRSGRVFYTVIAALISLLITAHAPGVAADSKLLRLATTTSTENSGLLSRLLAEFTRDTGYAVHVVAVGTGKALRMGQDGDADVVLVHARPAEDRFVAAGYGINRRDVMYNDFVLVGPVADPAGASKADNVNEALRRVFEAKHLFISRGDDSGTHKRELALWQRAGIKPGGTWYREAGQGMGRVLQVASELDAYTLSDRGTWLAYKGKLHLGLAFEGDPPLNNPYGIIAVNPMRFPDTNAAGASTLIDWITSLKAQRMINEFTVNGERLFIPLAVKVADL